MPRRTVQRTAILEVLLRAKHHPDAAWVYLQARKRLPRLSQATVYRQLERLVEEGEIRAISNPGGSRLYDANPQEHQHLVCEPSGELVDLRVDLTGDLQALLEKVQAAHPELVVKDVAIQFKGQRNAGPK